MLTFSIQENVANSVTGKDICTCDMLIISGCKENEPIFSNFSLLGMEEVSLIFSEKKSRLWSYALWS